MIVNGVSKVGLKREGGSVVTRQFPRALSSLRVRTNIFHQKILAKGWRGGSLALYP